MEFRWIPWNVAKVQSHGVSPGQAEYVIAHARPPYPQHREDDKWLVWGSADGGEPLQVVFVLDEDDTVFVIHARPLTEREKKRLRRSRR